MLRIRFQNFDFRMPIEPLSSIAIRFRELSIAALSGGSTTPLLKKGQRRVSSKNQPLKQSEKIISHREITNSESGSSKIKNRQYAIKLISLIDHEVLIGEKAG